jgi:hypothetical protein
LYDIGSGPTTNGFESDNDGSGSEANPFTDPTFSNITVLGPLANGVPLSYSNSFQNGARIRRNSSTSIFNSIFMGWNDALFIDGARSVNKHQNDTLMFKNNILAGNIRSINASATGGSNPTATRSKVFANANDSIFSGAGILADPFNYSNPNFAPVAGSPATSGASFSGARISDPYFQPTAYRGALGSNPDSNWTNCWCNFDPQNADYSTGNINRMPLVYDAGKDSAICSGKSLVIGQNLTGSYKAMWSPATGLSSASVARPVANPTVTTKYFVTVTDTVTGCSLTDSVLVSVNATPVANFTSVSGAAGLVTFTNTSTNATSYAWNLGDGNTSTASNPAHTYAANGVYKVSLTATAGACTNATSRDVIASGVL